MPPVRLFPCVSLSLAISLLGCDRDLGDCNLTGESADGADIDGPAAFDIVYRITDGVPMYEGQALIQSTCGDGSFCHAPAAEGSNRVGAPAGLDFDLSLVCGEDLATCEADETYDARVSRFNGDLSNVRHWAEGMIQEIRADAMPPGEAGRRVRDNTPWIRPDRPPDESQLPSIESKEGKEIVRNWLACQAPAIGRTEPAPTEADQLQPCGSAGEELTCVYSGPSGELPDPNWRDIYWSIMFTECLRCHAPLNVNTDQNPDNPLGGTIPGGASAGALEVLDLSGDDENDTTEWPDDSYGVVVDVSTSTAGACAGAGLLIDSGSPDTSIMVGKMYGTETCPPPGTVMPPPPGGALRTPLVDVVAEWAAFDPPPLD